MRLFPRVKTRQRREARNPLSIARFVMHAAVSSDIRFSPDEIELASVYVCKAPAVCEFSRNFGEYAEVLFVLFVTVIAVSREEYR